MIWPALLLLSAALQADAVVRMPPVDQCTSDAGFAAFRASLQTAIARRDGAFILSIIPEDILVNFGGERGREAFARRWRLDAADSPFWEELRATLALGCWREADDYESPSLGPQLADDYDPFEVLVAVRSGAAMRVRPDEAAEPIATLDWDVLLFRDVETPEDWMAVRMADGREGFVRRDDVRSPIDYRAHFGRSGGRWQMHLFIAGD